MASSISNTLQPLSPAALANAKNKGLGQGLSIIPSGANAGQVSTGQRPASLATTAAPAAKHQTTGTLAAPKQAAAGSLGEYKGVPIRAGSEADIQAQMRAIDSGGSSSGGVAPLTSNSFSKYANPTQTQAPAKGLFESVVGSLASAGPSKETLKAIEDYKDAVEDLQKFEESAASAKKGIYSAPSSAKVMQGRDAALQQANAEIRASLQGAVQQQQAAVGFGQTQQSLNQSALSSAATYAQPSPAGYGQAVFNPLTGTYSGGQGNLDPQSVAVQLANEVKSGRMTYEQAVSSLGYAGGAGQQFLNSALQGGGGGYNIPQGQANLAGQTAVLGQLPQLQAADVAAEGVKNKITTYLASNPRLNPADLAAGNKLQQWIQGKQLTDPKYQTLFNYLNEYTNTLAPILGVGGDPTNLKTEIAQRFVNAAASGQSIAEVLNNMQSLSRGKIDDIRSGATGGGVVSSPYSPGTGGSGGGNIYSW